MRPNPRVPGVRALRILQLTVFWIAAFSARDALSAPLPFSDTSQFATFTRLLEDSVTRPIVRTVGGIASPRAFDSATPLFAGIELGLQIEYIKLPTDLEAALTHAGLRTKLPASVPLGRIFLRKGFGKRVALGLSGIAYQGYRIYGAESKITLYHPDEGVSVALRAGISLTQIGFVSATAIAPQLLVSRKLSFADPYLGLGYTLINGGLTFAAGGYSFKSQASASGLTAFTGVKFKSLETSLMFIVEGSYSSLGASAVGIGLGFGLGGEEPKEPEKARGVPEGAL